MKYQFGKQFPDITTIYINQLPHLKFKTMPIGKVERPVGPEEQAIIGQILCSDGDIISFFNTKGLKKDEPVVFDIIRTKLKVRVTIDGVKYKYSAKTPVGILPIDFEVDNDNPEKKWPAKLQERWKKEWADFKDDDEINKIFGCPLKSSVLKHPHCD
ncbi:MAG: hypothetical protein HC819_00070 [Cyclobacteriaceae bacterium]|nr:hypothetical protein [Cyclobacteriaceae bacterium]